MMHDSAQKRWEDYCEIYKIPKKYQGANISNISIPNDLDGVSFKKRAENWLRKPESLLLIGHPGRGKTYFMHALIKGLLEKYPLGDVRFFRSKSLDDRMLEDLSKFGSVTYLIESISKVPFLFLDDLGIERDSDRVERDYYDIIDRRISDELPTVFSTNLVDEEEFNLAFGSRIISRLKECVELVFEGPDLRGIL